MGRPLCRLSRPLNLREANSAPSERQRLPSAVKQSIHEAMAMENRRLVAQRRGDTELADFFRRAQTESRKGAEHGKRMLRARLV